MRVPPISGAIILHSDTVDAPLTDFELGDLAIGLGPPTMLPPPRRGFFISDCVRGNTMSLICEDATMIVGGRVEYN